MVILLYMRNINMNKLQSILGVLFFSTNTECSVQSIVGWLGLSVAYSSTVNRLYSMSNTAVSHIWEIGQKWMRCEASFHIVYNNINQYCRNWHPSIASQTSLESGTATTLIMYPSTHLDAFDAYEYKERWQKIRQWDITVARIWNDIDCKHLEGACIVGILHILLKHIPGLKCFKTDFELFQPKIAKQPLPVWKAEIIPLQTSGNDKATTLGNHQTIHGIIDHQLMIKQEALTGHMIPIVSGQTRSWGSGMHYTSLSPGE